MNPALPILFLGLLAGCQDSSVRGQVRGVRNQAGDLAVPDLTPDTSRLIPFLSLPPPVTNAFFFHFTYPVWPLTNGCLLSSTDLVHWEERQDYWLTTNADHSVEWNVHFESTKSVEFFRARAETIGE